MAVADMLSVTCRIEVDFACRKFLSVFR